MSLIKALSTSPSALLYMPQLCASFHHSIYPDAQLWFSSPPLVYGASIPESFRLKSILPTFIFSGVTYRIRLNLISAVLVQSWNLTHEEEACSKWVTAFVNQCPPDSSTTQALPHSSFSSFTPSFWIYASLRCPQNPSHKGLFLPFPIKLWKITHLHFLIISLPIQSGCLATSLIKTEQNPMSLYKISISLPSLQNSECWPPPPSQFLW